jgi:hypothetical protein
VPEPSLTRYAGLARKANRLGLFFAKLPDEGRELKKKPHDLVITCGPGSSRWEYMMDETNERFLAEANEHIANAEVRIAGIHAHIAELELGGRDASSALSLLQELQSALDLMRRHRDEIARLLDKA